MRHLSLSTYKILSMLMKGLKVRVMMRNSSSCLGNSKLRLLNKGRYLMPYIRMSRVLISKVVRGLVKLVQNLKIKPDEIYPLQQKKQTPLTDHLQNYSKRETPNLIMIL